jgi:transposase
MMDRDDAEEYTQALGQVAAGSFRQVALGVRLGVPDALGITTREWVSERLGGYVRLSIPERRDAVEELTTEGMSQREVADVLGVDHATVGRDLGANAPRAEPEPVPETPPGGANAPPDPERLAALPAELAERVADGMSLAEAEMIARQRAERIAAWAERIREGLRTFGRMAGYPIPDVGLTDKERGVLSTILTALEGGDYGFLEAHRGPTEVRD